MIRRLLARLRLPMLVFACLTFTGCAEFSKGAETVLSVIAKAGVIAADADAWLQQNEAKIVSMAPSADQALLQADFDKAQADYRVALQLTGDATNLTEDAVLKNYAAFITDAQKLADDAEKVGLFKLPAASSNAMKAGDSAPPAPMSAPPPMPLVVVMSLKGKV